MYVSGSHGRSHLKSLFTVSTETLYRDCLLYRDLTFFDEIDHLIMSEAPRNFQEMTQVLCRLSSLHFSIANVLQVYDYL